MPPQAGGMSLFDLGNYAGKAGKKAAEMGRFFASEWLREPGAQQMLIGKVNPFLKKGIDQLSTAIRPKKIIKQTEKIWMEVEFLAICFMDLTMPRGLTLLEGERSDPNRKEKESTFTKQSENFQSQKAVGLFLGIITQGHIIHWNTTEI